MSEFALANPVHKDIYPFISPDHALKGAADGRSVLITGAGTGIGKATAEVFAQAGAKDIILVGRRLDVLENVKTAIKNKHSTCNVLAESCDVSDEEAVEQLFAGIKERNLELDVLVNNAGVNMDRATIKDSNVKNWWKNFEIMLKGPYMMSKAFLQAHTTDRPAAIIMTSTIGSYNTLPNTSAYGSSKAALNRITEWIAAESKDAGVQAIAFHPGGVANTDLTSKSPDWMQQYYTETPELGAGTCLYLSTARAAWLSGRYVDARWDLEDLENLGTKIVEEKLLRMSLLGDVRVMP